LQLGSLLGLGHIVSESGTSRTPLLSVDGSWHEHNGNAGSGNATTFTVDTATPTVAVSIDRSDINLAHNSGTVTFTFSEAPTDFTAANITAPGGTVSNLVGSGTSYTATFTAASNTYIADASISVDGNWYEHNGNAGSGSATTFTVDTVTPTVTSIAALRSQIKQAIQEDKKIGA
jgi:hypothetical protein